MSKEERNDFTNLILLCHPHHTIVDKAESHKYPAALLREWKAQREADGQAALAGLRNVTEERLQDLVTETMAPGVQQIQDAIRRLEQFDSEAAALLQGLINQLTDSRYPLILDEGIVRQLHEASRNISVYLDEGIIRQLAYAADELRTTLNEDAIRRLERTVDRLRTNLPPY
jgi:hypothetical protein